MATRAARIEQFMNGEEASEGTRGALLCEDNRGTYVIPFPCRYSEGVWLNEGTGEIINAEAVGWREWIS